MEGFTIMTFCTPGKRILLYIDQFGAVYSLILNAEDHNVFLYQKCPVTQKFAFYSQED